VASAARKTVRVWDPLVRLAHWSLVASIAGAWWAGEERLRWHELAGYAALAIVATRFVWGFAGPRHARFAGFLRSPGAVWRYAVAMAHQRAPRHVGHNPLGGWMVAALLAGVGAVGVTGWLYSLDMFWGLAWLDWLHRALAWGLVALIALHFGGVLFTSWRQRENLVAAMLNGRKTPAAGHDVD
jgi:cytochrome b